MKHKKMLLIVFFLTLFVFQQVKAGGTIPSLENPFQINLAPANAAFDHIGVWVLHLVDPTGEVATPRVACWTIGSGDYSFGCGSGDPLDPQSPHNPIYIDVDQYYLPDVLPREMNVNELFPTPEALKARAVAARALATWKAIYQYDGQPGYINNSTQYQVYIPGSYSTYTNPQDTVGVQQMISTAISATSGQYLSYNGEAIDAEFGSDMEARTQTEHLNPGDPPVDPFIPKAYLTGVEDPISTASCFNNSSGGHDYGMSQRGAIRWSLGNECPTGTGAVWPVTWTDYRQILVHYYTGIDILNASGGKVAPDDRWLFRTCRDFLSKTTKYGQFEFASRHIWRRLTANPREPDRWNLLKYENIPPTATPGQTITANLIWLQNTSTQTWNNAVLGYRWTGANGANTGWVETSIVLSTAKGDDETLTNVVITAPNDGASYDTLHLDVKANGQWISAQSPAWPDAQIAVTVNGGVATPTPIATPTTTVNYALQFNPTDAPKIILMPANTNLDFAMDMTVEFWIRTTSASGSGSWYQAPWILDKDIPGFGGSDWGISIQQGKIRSNFGAVSSAINNGAWHHVALTRDTAAGQHIIYIDGVQNTVAASGAASISNTLALIVGSENGAMGSLSRAFTGSLDELRIWYIARSPADIQANMSTALQGNEAGLVGYWDFNEGSGQTVFDKSSTLAHGQLGSTAVPDINDPTWISAPELFIGAAPTPVPTATPFPPNYTPPPIQRPIQRQYLPL